MQILPGVSPIIQRLAVMQTLFFRAPSVAHLGNCVNDLFLGKVLRLLPSQVAILKRAAPRYDRSLCYCKGSR